MEWRVVKCDYFGQLGNEIGLFGLVFAFLGAHFFSHLFAACIEKPKKCRDSLMETWDRSTGLLMFIILFGLI